MRVIESRDEGGVLLDAVVIIILVLVAVLILTHFGMTWSNILTSFRKFFGYVLGGGMLNE
jgi:hypothetical protein